jgi:hypothetical protein
MIDVVYQNSAILSISVDHRERAMVAPFHPDMTRTQGLAAGTIVL